MAAISDDYILKFAQMIKNGKFRHIVIITGAGISTNAGIPAYRFSHDIDKNRNLKDRSMWGFFEIMKTEFAGATPEDIFTRSFFDDNNVGSNSAYQAQIEIMRQADPTATHKFCKWVHDQGWLRRVYTQNIDGLHQKGGLPDGVVVEFHGSIFKNNIVLYGDRIPKSATALLLDDFVINPVPVDLILVMGTSLQVAPFCAIPNLAPKACTRALIDVCPQNIYKNAWSKKKIDYDYMYGLYGSDRPSSRSYCTFSKDRVKRRVTLRPLWGWRSKYKSQYIIRSDCDDFVGLIVS
jgi:NAD-dependent SIR2 family protein deacetylase